VSNIRQITDWRANTRLGPVYERLLGAIGTDAFGPTVWDSVLSVTAGARRIYLFEATGREDTSLQYFHGEPGLVELFPAYRKWYLRLDPVCDAYRAAPACSDVVMQRIRPTDIASPGFRRRFFDDAGIVERISIIQRGADSWRAINVARHASDGCCSDDELGSLIGLACLVLPMLPLNRQRKSAPLPLTAAQLEERFAHRYGSLTLRERQVCARAAVGMSVEATALDLGIGRTSVLTYRQRAYQRLGVASPIELCALVTH
jgi:DNA-binding CsgD family transcriptional regulator